MTKWQRLKQWTVWHPLNTDPDDQNRWGPRFWYPSYDIIAMILGIYAYFLGSPILNRLFSPVFTDAFAISIIVTSIVCLIGVVFPIINYIELIGKLVLVFILGAYAGTVLFMSKLNEPNGFVVFVLVMAIWLLGPRISVLSLQVQKNPTLVHFLAWKRLGFPRKKK